MKTRAWIVSAGARSSLGLDLTQTAFLLRTGVPAIAAAPLVDPEGEQVTMGFDPTLDPYSIGEERAAQLAAPALREALAPLGDAASTLSAELLLCLDGGPPPLRGEAAPGALLASRVHTRARELFPGIALQLCARGPAGPAFALPKSLDALASRHIDLLVLGGVHSDYDPAIVRSLAERGRLFTPKNLDAILLGEAAAFVVLTREEVARRVGLRPSARLCAVGSAMEAARPDNDASAFEATGLTAAVRGATEELAEEQLKAGWAFSDHSFELRRIHEWQAMITRTHARWGAPYYVESPAQRLGNLGAAALPLSIALATEGWKRGHAPSGIAVAFAGSDTGERGAISLLTNP
jgi:3-oxoacyl-[acyl-carrier-protein] synthase-1